MRHFPVYKCAAGKHNGKLIKQAAVLKELTSLCPSVLHVESCTAAVTKGGSIMTTTSSRAGVEH